MPRGRPYHSWQKPADLAWFELELAPIDHTHNLVEHSVLIGFGRL